MGFFLGAAALFVGFLNLISDFISWLSGGVL